MIWKVSFYVLRKGNSPVKDFIETLNEPMISKVVHYIELLEKYGPFLKPPYIKKFQDKLYELRIKGNVAVRIFYTKHQDEFILLHAFIKKTQKTPQKEIRTALERMREII